jgi:class 3 adenylate cyclase
MAEGPLERRLLAIVAADVVGYSRMMEADEPGTIARLQAVRAELIDPLIARHHGRIVKLMGDGALLVFESVVDAVACAVAIQTAVAQRNAGLPDAERIVFRVGVNLGDVALVDGDVYGDGVNIAARLEQLCEPGGVTVSGTVYDHLQGKDRRRNK